MGSGPAAAHPLRGPVLACWLDLRVEGRRPAGPGSGRSAFELLDGRNDDPGACDQGPGPDNCLAIDLPQGPGKPSRAIVISCDRGEVLTGTDNVPS